MSANLIKPLKDSPTEAYEEPIDPNQDGITSNGFFPQNATSSDQLAGVERDVSGNLTFKDNVLGVTKTLSQLASAGTGFDSTKLILEEDGSNVYIDDGDILLVI